MCYLCGSADDIIIAFQKKYALKHQYRIIWKLQQAILNKGGRFWFEARLFSLLIH